MAENKRKYYLTAGFIGMLLCGVGDILLSFRGEGEPSAVSGMISMSITQVPVTYYLLSFFIGIAASAGYFLASREMASCIMAALDGKPSRLAKLFGFGSQMMSVGIFGIHNVCCMALIAFKAAADAGLSAEQIDEYFTSVLILPFVVTTIWQTAADIMVAVAYIGLISKKVINIPKAWILCGPIVLYVIFGIIRAILNAVCAFSFACANTFGRRIMGAGVYVFVGAYMDFKREEYIMTGFNEKLY